MDPTITLDADLDAARARDVVAAVPDDFLVVVRRRPPDGGPEPLWYVLPVEDIRRRLVDAPDEQAVTDLLGLASADAEAARQVTSPEVQGGTWTGVVLDGTRVLGYARATRRVTRSLFPEDAEPAPAPVPPPSIALPASDGVDDPGPPPAAAPGPAPPPAEVQPTIEAYPTVEVPAAVALGAPFDVRVGLSAQLPAGSAPALAPLLAVPAPEETVELEIQVVADGFSAPDGARRTMTVSRSDPGAAAGVTVALVAPAQLPNAASGEAHAWRGVVEIDFSSAGVLLARAWREVVVSADPASAASSGTAGGGMALAPPGTPAADLTVTISEGTDPSRLVWSFTTAHPVDRPTEGVVSDLPVASALAFAMGQIKGINSADGTPVADNRILGVARAVSSATPVELWEVLTGVWTAVKKEGRTPSLLLVSCEPYVPWELASVEPDWVVDQSLLDPAAPPVLGAQLRMGRWLPAGPRTPSGVQRPAVPPATAIDVGRMAVVVGDYHAASGLRPLPEAMEEGKALTKAYPSVWVDGTLAAVASLLDDTLTDKGDKVSPDVVHMACHGEVSADHPASNGIVLSDSALRLDATIVRGSSLGRSSAPLVFLNACQLGQSSGDVLCDYGGLAGAFLTEGCRGFIAPLWSVDDGLAHDTAIDFYRMCLEDKVTVGEAFRQLRCRFNTIPGRDQTTPLAYVFYGHPDLRLALAPAAGAETP